MNEAMYHLELEWGRWIAAAQARARAQRRGDPPAVITGWTSRIAKHRDNVSRLVDVVARKNHAA